ncbi:MAG TPA: 50S ribosomal protein L25 [Bacteroidales bacterium]|jgi:large subunit ribosomal protein L25|nr:50S ribosomal protein L25 [Bacteroidales bacterium]HPY22636.1 50S ribosomal protein L25 [Bacteroidales bacterium]HQA93282.1 50S ribosomal protein L25 [Bacteroidales bacterium]
MKQIELKGELRTTGKKADVKNIRRADRVPCVLYGQGVENTSFSVDAQDLKAITHTPYSYIINLNIDGKKQLAKFQAVQYHPVTDKAIHVDFLAISADKPVTIDVPVVITGSSEGVKMGGKLMVHSRKLSVRGLINELPDDLKVDVTNLQLGKQIYAGNLSFDKVQIVSPKNTLICAVRLTRSAIAAAAAKEE